MNSKPRLGFSLIEVLIATVVLLVAVGVLTELAFVGRQHAQRTEDAAGAQRICQNLLDEILAGARPLQSTSESIVPNEFEWSYSVDIKVMDQFEWNPGLAELRVIVTKTPENGKRGKPFSLIRWIRYSSGEKKSDRDVDGPAAAPRRGPASGGPRL